MSEYEKAIDYLKKGCDCKCYQKISAIEFAETREDFQALSRSNKDIFLIAQLKLMNGGSICNSTRYRYLKRKKIYTFYQ